jgi:hypothetical protein
VTLGDRTFLLGRGTGEWGALVAVPVDRVLAIGGVENNREFQRVTGSRPLPRIESGMIER